MTSYVNVAIEGCCHGELDKIYQAIADNERRTHKKVDLLLVCGDFECVRDILDLECLAVPLKYRKLNSFHQYVTGEKVAPVTTIFVGGNHEASNVLQSLYYGGWVAPKIYFMGFAGVVNFRGLRIGGLSGIFYQKHYRTGHFETPPYTEDTLRSVYHMRELEVFRMAHLIQSDRPVDILLSHDWPAGIWDYGNRDRLLRTKPYFRDDMQSGKLGNPPLMHLLMSIKPRFWFSAHLHVKFGATVQHTPYPVQPQHADTTNSARGNAAVEDIAPPAESAEHNDTEEACAEVSASDPDELDISDLQDLINSSKQRIAAQGTDPTSTSAEAAKPPAPKRDASSADSSCSSELGKRGAPSRTPERVAHTASTSNTKTDADAELHYGIATHFLALDKVLPGREFLQIMQIPVPAATADTARSDELEFDPEWLAVLRSTHDLLQTHRGVVTLPQQVNKVTPQEIDHTTELLVNHFHSLCIPPIGPSTPTVIAGQCTPFPHSATIKHGSRGYETSSSTGYVSTASTSTDAGNTAYATTEHSSGEVSGYGTEHSTSDSTSSRSQLQYTQESYAHHQQMQMQQQQQRDQYNSGGRGGRGRGRGRNQQQGNGFNSAIYGPGGGGGSGRGGRGNNDSHGGHGSKGHGMIFNPTSRVTPLGNAQTDELLQALGLLHIWTRPCEYVEATAKSYTNTTTATGTGTGTADSTASSADEHSPRHRAARDVTLTAEAFAAPTPPTMAPPRYTMSGTHSTLPGAFPPPVRGAGSGARPPLPPGPPPLQGMSGSAGAAVVGNVGTSLGQMGDLNRPGALQNIHVVGTAASVGGTDDKYGLHAYYGKQAAYVMPEETVSTGSTGEDPSELNIEDAAGDEKANAVTDNVTADPNMIDLDF